MNEDHLIEAEEARAALREQRYYDALHSCSIRIIPGYRWVLQVDAAEWFLDEITDIKTTIENHIESVVEL